MNPFRFAITGLALGLAACSAPSTDPAAPGNVTGPVSAASVPSIEPTPSAASSQVPDPGPTPATLTLEGLGALKIGQPVPAGSGWSARGAQVSDACTTVTSPDFPGVYAIVEGGMVQRVSVGQRSGGKLVEGIGIGSSEPQVMAEFGGFRATPHKYVEAPGKYLTAPNAASGEVALRFEIGSDRKVTAMHVGTMPVLGYVEGCA